jgi:transposase
MLSNDLRQTIRSLHEKNQSSRSISRLLRLSRNTVRAVLAEGVEAVPVQKETLRAELMPVLREVFARCKGNAVRIQEVLKREYDTDIAYSTLTHLIQQSELRSPPKRAGEYHFEPGVEMQHDTSPHSVTLGDTGVKAQCASLVLAHSRYLFMQYYPCFTRFEAKTFLSAAFAFMQGNARRCVVDNTSVILAAGSGADAVIAPEMAAFSRMFGFEFIAHRIGHADRKARVERPFYYIETNFLAGRQFKDWEDLNVQARNWCIEVTNKKEKRALGMSPQIAYVQEKPYLVPLPEVLPPIYEHVRRIVDSKGFISLENNRYSVPEKLINKQLDVYKYLNEVRIDYQHKEVAVHARLAGKRYGVSRLKEHHTQFHYRQMNQALRKTEEALTACHDIVGPYISELKKHTRGDGLRKLNRLLAFKHTYPFDAFIRAVKQAQHYRLYDVNRLEEIIIKLVAGDYFTLTHEETDE